MADCIFCRIVAGQIPAKIVYEDPAVLAFHDLQPQAPIHLLIVPKQHLDRVSDLDENTALLAGQLVAASNRLAQELGIAQTGYRLVINCNSDGGQSVYHLHLHLLGGRPMPWPPG